MLAELRLVRFEPRSSVLVFGSSYVNSHVRMLTLLAYATMSQTPVIPTPTIWADVPDISVVRVGRDYYMSSTTMHMNPGVPIMKSRDLVNWRTVSYCYDNLGSSPRQDLLEGKNEYGKGTWASSLRFHEGTFYCSTFSSTTGKTYIFSTKTPDKGPWKKIEFSPSLHDHSLVFDGGKAYMIYGVRQLRIVELNDDLSGIKKGGVNQVLINDASAPTGAKSGLMGEGVAAIQGRRQVLLVQHRLAAGFRPDRGRPPGRFAPRTVRGTCLPCRPRDRPGRGLLTRRMAVGIHICSAIAGPLVAFRTCCRFIGRTVGRWLARRQRSRRMLSYCLGKRT